MNMNMKKLSRIRSKIGALGGAARSKAKIRAARLNGAKGGRPKKTQAKGGRPKKTQAK